MNHTNMPHNDFVRIKQKMAMASHQSFCTRRNFLKLFAFVIPQFVIGCSSRLSAADNIPGHHINGCFRNFPIPPVPSVDTDMSFYFRRFRGAFSTPQIPPDHQIPEKRAIRQFEDLKDNNTLTWLGHASFLLRISGKTILTDPFLTERASPVSWGGPKRYVPPGISLPNLPQIDIIVVSHNHYDHLDAETIENLPGKQKTDVMVPLGLKDFFVQRGYAKALEFDWGDQTRIHGLRLTSLPAVHFSGREIGDRNKSLWCSWAIATPSGIYYFAGDTAYSSAISRKIGNRFQSVKLAIVPIGAYEPRAMMKPFHTTPEEALQLGMDIKAMYMVSSHWGTIELSDEPHWEPPKRFKTHAKNMGLPADKIWNMKIGETRILP